MLGVGDPAPEFEARDCQGRTVRLGDYRGRRLVLFFFPKAFTAGCTEEIRHFRDNQARIRALGGELVGVSVDRPGGAVRVRPQREDRVPAARRQRPEDQRAIRRPLATGAHQPPGDLRGLARGAHRGGHPARAAGLAAPRRRHHCAGAAGPGHGSGLSRSASRALPLTVATAPRSSAAPPDGASPPGSSDPLTGPSSRRRSACRRRTSFPPDCRRSRARGP